MAEPRGAGRAGGLLFLLVALFVGYLAVQAVAGLLRLAIGVAIVVVLAALVINVVRRR